MELRRLRLLHELARHGSMRAVADVLGVTTSTVSQQLAVLADEVGAPLVEPDGRRVRLTPAGRRLAEHAGTILAAVEVARLDLDPDAEPAGVVRVSGFATAVRRTLLPVVRDLATTSPAVRLRIREQEPPEALALLADDEIDLALVYDYDLAPDRRVPGIARSRPLWSASWGLGVPAAWADGSGEGDDSRTTVARHAGSPWIVNSRHRADEDVVRVLAGLAGFEPRVEHRADSLDLLEDLVAAGLGVGVVPSGRPSRDGVRVLPLRDPGVRLRCYAATRAGSQGWAPLALVLRALSHDVGA